MAPRRFLLVAASLLALAAAPPPKPEPTAEAGGAVMLAGKRVEYLATSGRLPVKDKTGKAGASVFFVAYTKKDIETPAARPVTFCFNGGPGSSSVWLHLGAFGPRRVLLADDGRSAPAPFELVENEWSLLDLTDLVFIDPVSTGYSRADDPKEAKLFHGVEEDVSSVGEFIRRYVAKYKRGESPKYLAGESYGTTRAAGLSTYLQDRAGIKLTGIMLVSAVLDFETIRFGQGNDFPFALFLPTYTACAWYHKKLDKALSGDLAKAVEESRRYADGAYAQALRKGYRLSEGERQAVAKQLARLTGMTEKFVLDANLRIDANRFRRELLRDKELAIGRYDARVTGAARGGRGGRGDPSYSAILDAFTKGMDSHLSGGLKYKSVEKYQLNSAPVQPWNYGQAGNNRYLNVAPRLRAAMDKNPSLRVFVANGYYDLATPFAGTEYTLSHLGPRKVTDRVTMAYYEAGHMMYTNKDSLKSLKADIAAFMGKRPEVTAE
jgi:carboxypeptidase C (cathepsin A)